MTKFSRRITRSLPSLYFNKILTDSFATLVTVKSEAMSQMSEKNLANSTLPQKLIYSPNIVLEGEQTLIEEICKHRPTVLVVGADKISKNTLEIWRALFDKKTRDGSYEQQLLIVRRGTSLAAIDMNTAAKLGITISNTPSVNAVEVAKSTYDIIRDLRTSVTNKFRPSALGLIGFGHIGIELAMKALKENNRVIAYSPRLYDAYQRGKTDFRNFDITKIKVAGSIEQVIEVCDELAVSVTIGQYGNGKIIGSDALQLLKWQSRIVCISEPEVFSQKGLEALAEASHQKDIRVVFDNSPYMMKKLSEEIADAGGKMENFTFQSKVMSSLDCQRDMDIAASALLLKNAIIKQLPEIYRSLKDCEFEIDNAEKKVVIVGAGISSMMVAFYFQESGYQIEILEKDSKENQQGITRSGKDARHLSYSETITHAATERIKNWLFEKVTNPDYFEKLFTEQFKVIGNNQPLVLILQSVTAEINKVAIKGEFGWEYLRDKYPDIFAENMFGLGKILRVFYGKDELEKAHKFQTFIHDSDDEVRIVEPEELKEKVPQLKHMIDSEKIAGAVEVVGYGVRVTSLCDAIEKHLFEQSGVEIQWQREVQKEGERFFVKNQKGEIQELSQEVPLVISSGVSPIIAEDKNINKVYGLFISLPNCGLKDPLKIHEKDPLGVMNITPSKDGKKLHISAGFQYFGSRSANEEDLKSLFTKLEEKIADLFPESYAQATKSNSLERYYCPRPMTSHGLPHFTQLDNGVSFGGGNSGGTVQATLLGQLALLQVQYNSGLFKKNCELNQQVGEFLETAQDCFSYIKTAIKADQQLPSNSVSNAVEEKIFTSEKYRSA